MAGLSRDVHPMEEAHGFKALLDLEEPTYSIEQIAAKTGESPAFVAARLKRCHESVGRVEWIHDKVVRLLPQQLCIDHQRFAKVGLRFAQSVEQGYRHLPLRTGSPRT